MQTDRKNKRYFPKDMFFGNFAGNNHKGSSYYWIEMVCNDASCKYQAVIKSEVLGNLLN